MSGRALSFWPVDPYSTARLSMLLAFWGRRGRTALLRSTSVRAEAGPGHAGRRIECVGEVSMLWSVPSSSGPSVALYLSTVASSRAMASACRPICQATAPGCCASRGSLGRSGPSSCSRSSTARRRCRSACSYFARFRQVLPMASRAVASASGRPANRSPGSPRPPPAPRPPSRRPPGRLARLPVGRPRARRRPESR